jgi:hypothetical protein
LSTWHTANKWLHDLWKLTKLRELHIRSLGRWWADTWRMVTNRVWCLPSLRELGLPPEWPPHNPLLCLVPVRTLAP